MCWNTSSGSTKYSIHLRTAFVVLLFYVEHFVHRFLPHPHLIFLIRIMFDPHQWRNDSGRNPQLMMVLNS